MRFTRFVTSPGGGTAAVLSVVAWFGLAGCASPPQAAAPAVRTAIDAETAQPVVLWLRSDDLTQPIVAWLRSVREGRSADLPRVLSTRVRRALGPIPWEALRAYYATSWAEQLGTAQWQPEDFLFVGTVQYAGTDRRAAADPQTMDRAEVRLRFLVENGVPKDLRVNVVREGQAWFVDEFPSGFTAR